MGLIQRRLDEVGLSTIGITLVPEVTTKTRPSRLVFIERPFGLTFGDAGEAGLQKEILLRCLREGVRFKERGGVLPLPYRWEKDDLREKQLRKEAE